MGPTAGIEPRGTVPAGVPQGTKLGPWLYLIMINSVGVTDADQWKYVDDTTVAEEVLKNDASAMQEYVDDLSNQSLANKFQLNETKCKELCISFAKRKPDFAPIRINDKEIEVVTLVKLLGLNILSGIRTFLRSYGKCQLDCTFLNNLNVLALQRKSCCYST